MLQWWLTLCNPMDGSLPGSSVHRFLQARIPKGKAGINQEFGINICTLHNTDSQQGTVQCRELYSIFCNNPYRKRIWQCAPQSRRSVSHFNNDQIEETQGHPSLQSLATLQPFFQSQPSKSATQLSSITGSSQHHVLSLTPSHPSTMSSQIHQSYSAKSEAVNCLVNMHLQASHTYLSSISTVMIWLWHGPHFPPDWSGEARGC